MIRLFVCVAVLSFVPLAVAQRPPTSDLSEEYCRKFPKAILCRDGRPIKLEGFKVPLVVPKDLGLGRTGTRPAPQAQAAPQPPAADWRIPISPAPLPQGQAQARLSQGKPDLLMSIRPKALFDSKWMMQTALGLEAQQAQAPEAGAVRELRLSVTRNAAGAVQALVLLTGDTAALAAAGDSFRSKGITACFLDATTLLAGPNVEVNAALQRIFAPGAAAPWPAESADPDDISLAVTRQFVEAARKPGSTSAGLPDGVIAMTIGMRLRETLHYSVLMQTPAANADKLLAQANKLAWIALAPEQSGEAPPEFLKNITAAKTPRGVRLEFTVDPAQLPAPMIEQLRSALSPMREALGITAQQKKVVIQGL